MFCDLVGSTSLAAKMDAEDWRNLVNAYLEEASKAVNAFGGHVLKRLGDGLMALFGFPQAQENDAERALRAALAIQRALAELNARNASGMPQLSARIGLDFSPVVVDATGEVFGEAPNVAARAEGVADPGAIFATAAVQRQVTGLFVAEDTGAHALKGVPAPVTLYRIVRASDGCRRGRARAPATLVGAAEELDLLMRRWERARFGQGQFVQIVGEPGIGKSRLVEEFHARIAETSHTWAEFSSSQLCRTRPCTRSPNGAASVSVTPAPPPASVSPTLKTPSADRSRSRRTCAPACARWSTFRCRRTAPRTAPEELRRRQLAALTSWFLAGARSNRSRSCSKTCTGPTRPRWTSCRLSLSAARRLRCSSSRPRDPSSGPLDVRSHHGVISLSPLDPPDVARMVGEIVFRHALSRE